MVFAYLPSGSRHFTKTGSSFVGITALGGGRFIIPRLHLMSPRPHSQIGELEHRQPVHLREPSLQPPLHRLTVTSWGLQAPPRAAAARRAVIIGATRTRAF